MGFSDDIVSDSVAPPWWQVGSSGEAGTGGRYLQTIGDGLQTIFTRIAAASLNGIPGAGDVTAIPLLAADRLLYQGGSESNTTFSARLSAAYDAWRIAGGDWSILCQFLSLLTPATPQISIVSDSYVWSYYTAAASTVSPPIQYVSAVANWLWDGHLEVTGMGPGVTQAWWRFWVVIDLGSWVTSEGNWGAAGNWGDTTASWGLSVPATIFVAMRSVLAASEAANAWCRWIVIRLTASMDPNGAPNDPDGNYGQWYKIVSHVYVQSRTQGARYVDGWRAGQ